MHHKSPPYVIQTGPKAHLCSCNCEKFRGGGGVGGLFTYIYFVYKFIITLKLLESIFKILQPMAGMNETLF